MLGPTTRTGDGWPETSCGAVPERAVVVGLEVSPGTSHVTVWTSTPRTVIGPSGRKAQDVQAALEAGDHTVCVGHNGPPRLPRLAVYRRLLARLVAPCRTRPQDAWRPRVRLPDVLNPCQLRLGPYPDAERQLGPLSVVQCLGAA
jgi:hypothetical protein